MNMMENRKIFIAVVLGIGLAIALAFWSRSGHVPNVENGRVTTTSPETVMGVDEPQQDQVSSAVATDPTQAKKQTGADGDGKMDVESLVQPLIRQMDRIAGQLEKVSERLSRLEKDYNNSQARQDLDVSNAAGAMVAALDEQTGENIDESQSLEQLQRQAAETSYYNILEQRVGADIDPLISQQYEAAYDQLVNSRPDWQQHASLDSALCGSKFCKVVVTYDKAIDQDALFELDASLIMQNLDYPTSTSRTVEKPDNTMEMTVYFAKDQTSLPILER